MARKDAEQLALSAMIREELMDCGLVCGLPDEQYGYFAVQTASYQRPWVGVDRGNVEIISAEHIVRLELASPTLFDDLKDVLL